jgi:DNA-binding HxlR family transcriptional regulator
MRHTEVDELECSVARSWTILGERWTMLVLKEAFVRTRRFEDFQAHLGIARNVLADRLGRLVDEGILERRRYQERPPRDEYRLTEKGLDLYAVIVSIAGWGDRHLAGRRGPSVERVHRGCGHVATLRLCCEHCGEPVTARDMRARGRALQGMEERR